MAEPVNHNRAPKLPPAPATPAAPKTPPPPPNMTPTRQPENVSSYEPKLVARVPVSPPASPSPWSRWVATAAEYLGWRSAPPDASAPESAAPPSAPPPPAAASAPPPGQDRSVGIESEIASVERAIDACIEKIRAAEQKGEIIRFGHVLIQEYAQLQEQRDKLMEERRGRLQPSGFPEDGPEWRENRILLAEQGKLDAAIADLEQTIERNGLKGDPRAQSMLEEVKMMRHARRGEDNGVIRYSADDLAQYERRVRFARTNPFPLSYALEVALAARDAVARGAIPDGSFVADLAKNAERVEHMKVMHAGRPLEWTMEHCQGLRAALERIGVSAERFKDFPVSNADAAQREYNRLHAVYAETKDWADAMRRNGADEATIERGRDQGAEERSKILDGWRSAMDRDIRALPGAQEKLTALEAELRAAVERLEALELARSKATNDEARVSLAEQVKSAAAAVRDVEKRIGEARRDYRTQVLKNRAAPRAEAQAPAAAPVPRTPPAPAKRPNSTPPPASPPRAEARPAFRPDEYRARIIAEESVSGDFVRKYSDKTPEARAELAARGYEILYDGAKGMETSALERLLLDQKTSAFARRVYEGILLERGVIRPTRK